MRKYIRVAGSPSQSSLRDARFPLLSPAVTSVPLFVTYGDISPRPGRICPGRGKSFLKVGALGSPHKLHLLATASPFGRGGCERSEQTERASPLKEKASAMDFPVLCKPENIAETFLSPFHGMGGEHLFVLPPHRLTGGKGLFHIQQTLVAAAAEPQGDIVLGFNKFAVH